MYASSPSSAYESDLISKTVFLCAASKYVVEENAERYVDTH